MKNKFIQCCLTLALASVSMLGCNNGDGILGAGDLVTVRGVVYNIDTLLPARGVKVYLYNHEADFNTTTDDTDGSFQMQIPVGTKFILVTDDAVEGEDNWFTLANFEVFKPEVDGEFTTAYRIHACPSATSNQGWNSVLDAQLDNMDVYGFNFGTFSMSPRTFSHPTTGDAVVAFSSGESGTPKGSVAIWEQYVAGTASSKTNLFPDVTSLDESAILSISLFQFGNNIANNPAEIAVTSDKSTEFGPIAYTKSSNFTLAAIADTQNIAGNQCTQFFQDTTYLETNGNEILNEAATSSEASNGMISFGKPTFPDGGKVTLTFQDVAEPARTIANFPSTMEVYVKPGMISLVLWGFIDNENNQTYEAVSFEEVVNPVAAANQQSLSQFNSPPLPEGFLCEVN